MQVIKEQLLNNSEIEVTGHRSGGELTVTMVDGGTSNQRWVFNYKGRIRKNKPTVIGTIKVSTPNRGSTSYMPKNCNFISKEINKSLNRKSTLELQLINVEKIGNTHFHITPKKAPKNVRERVISRTYNVVYTRRDSNGANSLNYTFNHNQRAHGKYTLGADLKSLKFLNNIYAGRDVSAVGENRLITLKGTPGLEFEFAFLKYNDSIDSDGNVLSTTYEDALDKKYYILDASKKQKTYTLDNIDCSVGKRVLNSKGVASFLVNFPPNNTGENKRYNIIIISTKAQSWQVKGDQSKEYAYIVERSGWAVNKSPFQNTDTAGILHKVFNQYSAQGLSLTIATSNANITSVNGGSFAALKPEVYRGSGNVSSNKRAKQGYIIYTLLSASHTFAFKGGITNAEMSNWTNIDSTTNGGTLFYINGISVVLSDTGGVGRNNTCAIRFKPDVVKLGTKKLTSALNIDDVVACA